MRIKNIIPVFLAMITLVSCIGVKADIVFNSDKSGTIALEYRMSGLLESLGKLDGNEAYPPVPVGKTDFERTIARLPGVKLVSWNSREDKNDKIIDVKLQFANPGALAGFLDAGSGRALYAEEGGTGKLTFILSDGKLPRDPNFYDLFRRISAGYNFSVSVSLPAEGKLSLTGNDGKAFTGAAEMVSGGRKPMFSMPLEMILFAQDGLKAEFSW